MMKYVLGLVFNEDLNKVLLIKKEKPSFQKGRLNGIGGKIESGEDPLDAMIREFNEEAGVLTKYMNWHKFLILRSENEYDNFDMHCFFLVNEDVYNCATTMETEEVVRIDANKLPNNVMDNLKWIIPLAKDSYRRLGDDFVRLAEVTETHEKRAHVWI